MTLRLPSQSRGDEPGGGDGSAPPTVIHPGAAHPTVAADPTPTTLDEALTRMYEAEDTLRAIGAGEIDALVVSDGGTSRRVFTLSTADRPYRMFVENMIDGAATLSSGGIVLYANGRLAQLLCRAPESIVGVPLSTFLADGASPDWLAAPDGTAVGTSVECELSTAHGLLVPVLVGVSALEVDDGHILCLTFTDLSAQKAQDREIARLGLVQADRLRELQDAQAALTLQATHDSLTGLPNRALLVDRIDQSLAQARRSGHCTAVYFIDLDSFKRINDTHGHAAGDEVLKAAGERLVRSLRPMDTVARIGGDEFVVLAHDVDHEVHAVDIGTRLAATVRRSSRERDDDAVSASIGIAVSAGGRGTAEILLNEADAAMYQAKSRGGNRAAVFDAALGLQAQQRATAHKMLQSALDLHNVVVFYQPIVDLTDGAIAGFEALARLSAADGGIIAPSAFIPIAEESGLVVPLGAEVLELACVEATRWTSGRGAAHPLSVAVNLSSRQLENGNLVATVRDRLAASGLPPESLHLELTETATIDLRHDVLQQLGKLRDLGVEIGLDDFGTGYGSLTHLRRLPLTFVKIDQTFVRGLGTDTGDERIVSAVATLTANLGLRSIAEGVETVEQLRLLREIGCDQAQGYLFARPMPTDDIADALTWAPWHGRDADGAVAALLASS